MLNSVMPQNDLIPTRASLLRRLKDLSDSASWNEFYEVYRGLIFCVARRAGLNEVEAGDVVQDTLISVAKKMTSFTYDPAKDSFRGWLLTLTRWRIQNQLARRKPRADPDLKVSSPRGREEDTRTGLIERVPDPAGSELAAVWEEEWEAHLLRTALARIKRQVHPRHYQVYHLHVVLGQPAAEVALALDMKLPQVYLAKHRVGTLLKKEVRKLRETLL